MKFKIDENLPAEAAEILRDAGFVADTVGDEDLSGADDETIARLPSTIHSSPAGVRLAGAVANRIGIEPG